jgi:hypothetical protein
MRGRERVLRAYGGRCRWCRAPGPLQIDHVFGGGTAHRKALGVPPFTWLHPWDETPEDPAERAFDPDLMNTAPSAISGIYTTN